VVNKNNSPATSDLLPKHQTSQDSPKTSEMATLIVETTTTQHGSEQNDVSHVTS